MNKEEYINIIKNEIIKNQELKDNLESTIEFNSNLYDKDMIYESQKNLILVNKRLEMLKKLEFLPIYYRISNMNSFEIRDYIEERKFELEQFILLREDEIKKIEDLIQVKNNEINKYYENYKLSKDSNLIEKSKKNLNIINDYKFKIESLKKEIDSFVKELDRVSLLKDEEAKKELINELKLNELENELNRVSYIDKTSNIDDIVFSLCSNLKIFDIVIENMREYNKLFQSSTNKRIIIPDKFNNYIFDESFKDSIEYIVDGIDSENLNKNTLFIENESDFDVISNNLDYYIHSLEEKIDLLEDNKSIIYQFPREKEDVTYNRLKSLSNNWLDLNVSEILDKLFLLNEKKKKLDNKKIQTKKHLKEYDYLELSISNERNILLNKLWYYYTHNVINAIDGINDCDVLFCENANTVEIEARFLDDYPIVVDVANYSDLSVLNVLVLLKQLIHKLSMLINEANEFKLYLEKEKKTLIKDKKIREECLDNIKKRINKLYSELVPNSDGIDPGSYYLIERKLTTDKITDSLVKVERDNIINNVLLESKKQTEYVTYQTLAIDKMNIRNKEKNKDIKKLKKVK